MWKKCSSTKIRHSFSVGVSWKAIAKNATLMKNCMYSEFEQRELTDVIATLWTNFSSSFTMKKKDWEYSCKYHHSICFGENAAVEYKKKKKTLMKLQLPVG